MMKDYEKMKNAKNVLLRIAKGTDPLTGEVIAQDSFLNDPEIIRSFYFMSEVLDYRLDRSFTKGQPGITEFHITPEQKIKVSFPEAPVGVNDFSRCINACIDLGKSKRLTGAELNKRLKGLGILSEINTEDQKKRTVINENSLQYGFESEKRIYNGSEYEKVVINGEGKKYLLDNIEVIMNGTLQTH